MNSIDIDLRFPLTNDHYSLLLANEFQSFPSLLLDYHHPPSFVAVAARSRFSA